MSHNNMELLKRGDGTIRLAFWDSLHGADAVFVLQASGQAWRAEEAEEDGEAWLPVSLVQELRALALAWETEEERE